MATPYPGYFVIDGRPVKVVAKGDGTEVLALDPATGAMVPDSSYRDRVSGPQVEKQRYRGLLSRLRQPILERYATAPLRWEWSGDSEVPYRLTLDGHELTIRLGDFPDEALYLMHIDGQGVYELDHWPNAWKTPEPGSKAEPARSPIPHPSPRRGPSPRRSPRGRGTSAPTMAGSSTAASYRRSPAITMRPSWPSSDAPALEPITMYRLYVCHCAYHLEGGEHPLDDTEGVQVGTQWTCVGHPFLELPHELDGVLVTADNLADLVARALANELPANLRESDRRAGVWAARLAIRLDGTPHQERVVAAAAAHLTHADATIRSRAVQFFANAPKFASAMHAEVLLGQHSELFVGVPNPHGAWSFEKTLEYLVCA